MTTLFGIAFLLAILALIEGICICTKRKLHNQKRPASCYVLLSALELRPDWKAELNHLFSDLQWQVSLQTAEIFFVAAGRTDTAIRRNSTVLPRPHPFPMWNIFGIPENFNGMSFSIEK